MTTSHFEVRPEVREALAQKRAVVALESTVISHGLPYPANIETAFAMEVAVRSAGAVPATVGILDGRIVVGLGAPEIERLATSKEVVKVSRRDMGPVLAQRRLGATTVAATMLVSGAVGIRFFATGGIGGVHRGAQSTFDVSADLSELSRTPVAVVCAGPKAVLDIGLTREVLETLGVPIIGFQTSELPAFYSTSSGYPVDYTAGSHEELALMAATHWEVNASVGILIVNPPPVEFALERGDVEEWIARALGAAEDAGVSGKAVTPFLLTFLAGVSGGRTLTVNKSLLIRNGELAGGLANSYRNSA